MKKCITQYGKAVTLLLVVFLLYSAFLGATRAEGTLLLGEKTVGTYTDYNPEGMAEAFLFTASATGTADRITLYIDATSTATEVVVGLYSHVAWNGPMYLLSQSSFSNPVNGTWNSVTIPATKIDAGKNYWVAILTPPGKGVLRFRDVLWGNDCQTSYQQNLACLPSNWYLGTRYRNSPLSVYVEQTVSPPTQFTLAVGVVGNGSVLKSPAKSAYDAGEAVQLTAVPSIGYKFVRWSGDATGTTNPVTVTMDEYKAVTAQFVPEAGDFLFGAQALGSYIDYNPEGVAEAFLYTATFSGSADRITLFVDATNTATEVMVGLYANGPGDEPAVLLTQDTLTSIINGAWNSVAIPPTTIIAGQKYWIAFVAPPGKGIVRFRDELLGTKCQTSKQENLTSLPSTWVAGTTYMNGPVSAYVEQTSVPLPVQLSTFVGKVVQNGMIRLEWTTMTETNNYGFEIQKSTDPSAGYTTLPNSFVPGNGTSLVPHAYSFTENSPSEGRWYYRLKQLDLDGSITYSDGIAVAVLAGVQDEEIPAGFSLEQNYPNPCNPSTEIRFSVDVASHTTLSLYNMLGQEVAVLFDDLADAGHYYSVVLNGTRLASGVYLYRLQSGQKVEVKRMTILK